MPTASYASNRSAGIELRNLIKETFGAQPTRAAREFLFDKFGYKPSPEQAEFHFMEDEDGKPVRVKIVSGGEQAGKSRSAAMELASRLLWGELFWIVGPDYRQTQREFEYVADALQGIGALLGAPSRPDKGSWSLETVWGAKVATYSAVDTAKIAGDKPDGILLVEAAQCTYEAFLRVVGRIGPSRGWACVNGTFEQDKGGWLKTVWKIAQSANEWNAKSINIPTWSNRVLYPGGREDPEILRLEKINGPDWFAERFAGVPTAPKNLVFREFNHKTHVRYIKRTRQLEFDMCPDDKTVVLPEDTEDELWIDPGYAGGYAVLFVTVWNDIAFVYDEIYKTGWTSDEMAQQAARHPRWKYVRTIVMDIAGKQHQAQKSPMESWKAITGIMPKSQKVGIIDGIQRTRISLRFNPETGLPGMFFSDKCVMTVWELAEGYKYDIDRRGNIESELPEDKNNHSAKAIAYGLVHRYGLVRRTVREKIKLPRHVAPWERF